MFRGLGHFVFHFILMLALWIGARFGAVSLDQILFHLKFAGGGLNFDPKLFQSFLLQCTLLPILLSMVSVFFVSRVRKQWIQKIGFPVYSILVILFFAVRVDAVGFVRARLGEDFMTKHYVDPLRVSIKIEERQKPKNLILIYVESLERSFNQTGIFHQNLLEPLESLEKLNGAFSFQSFDQMPGTGWTIAGISSGQCGVPLKLVDLVDVNRQGEVVENFMPGAHCLGDVLAERGYRNVFMGGASLSFAGKGKFLATHGYAERYGSEEWLAEGVSPTEMGGWGLRDEGLFRKAREKLGELQKTSTPWNLTLLTSDTHPPEGFSYGNCNRLNPASGLESAVNCSSGRVADFVAYALRMGVLKNTAIVVLGDHLMMQSSLSDGLQKIKDRSIYNLFLTENAQPKNRDRINHFDLYPTLLELLGFKVDGARLGIGYSGIGESPAKISGEFLTEMKKNVLNESKIYQALWTPGQKRFALSESDLDSTPKSDHPL